MIGIYVRTSTIKQSKKYSPKVQRDRGIIFANSLNEEYVVYEESASGGSLERQKLKEMFSDIEKGFVKKVWVIEQSRISRDMEDSTLISNLFLKYNCDLYIDGDVIELNSSRSRFFYNISSAVSDYERSEILTRMKRGRDASFDKGKKVLSRCYGYTFEWVDGKRNWIIDKYQSDIVILVFKLFVEEKVSISKIMRTLNNRGIKSFDGGYWSDRVIKRLLVRKEYAGLTTDSLNNLIKSEIYQPIIDEDLWYKSCQRINAMTAKYKESHESFRFNTGALSNIIKCKYCGMPYKFRNQVRKYRGKEKDSEYLREIYFHSGDITCHPQTPKMFYKHQVVSAFEISYLKSFLDNNSRQEWMLMKKREIEIFNSSHSSDLSMIEKQLKEVNMQIDNLIDALSMGLSVDRIKGKLSKLEQDKENLIASKKSINDQFNVLMMNYEDAEKYFLNDVIEQITEYSDVDKRQMYNEITKECWIKDHHFHIEFVTGDSFDYDLRVFHSLASDKLASIKDIPFEKEHTDDVHSRILIRAVEYGSMIDLKKQAKELKHREESSKGSHCLGFDYVKQKKKCIINRQEANVVKYIFDLKQQDLSLSEIADNLYKNEMKKKRGSLNWEIRDVKNVLNKIQLSGRWYDKDGDIIDSDRFPEIISPEIFDKINS